jgi:Protein of unknown function (DUF2924)
MARFLCWHVQEQAFGGLDPEIAKHLDRLARGAKPGADHPRRLKPGTVLLREYLGERHTVTVVPNGYVWHGTTYASLSIIARAITGTSWNGPRFFGLRSGAEPRASSEVAKVSPAPKNKRRLVRAAKSHPAGAAQRPDGLHFRQSVPLEQVHFTCPTSRRSSARSPDIIANSSMSS